LRNTQRDGRQVNTWKGSEVYSSRGIYVDSEGGNNNFSINCERQDSNSRPGL
jgi:hypothetical protein